MKRDARLRYCGRRSAETPLHCWEIGRGRCGRRALRKRRRRFALPAQSKESGRHPGNQARYLCYQQNRQEQGRSAGGMDFFELRWQARRETAFWGTTYPIRKRRRRCALPAQSKKRGRHPGNQARYLCHRQNRQGQGRRADGIEFWTGVGSAARDRFLGNDSHDTKAPSPLRFAGALQKVARMRQPQGMRPCGAQTGRWVRDCAFSGSGRRNYGAAGLTITSQASD